MKSLRKKIKQALTAIWLPADVSMEWNKTCMRGGELECLLFIKSQKSEIDVEKISFALMAEENVEVEAGYQTGYDSESEKIVEIYVGSVTSTTTTFNEIFAVIDAIILEPNREYSWKANFVVPNYCKPTYHGVDAHHKWYLSTTITLSKRKLFGKKNFSYQWDELIVL